MRWLLPRGRHCRLLRRQIRLGSHGRGRLPEHYGEDLRRRGFSSADLNGAGRPWARRSAGPGQGGLHRQVCAAAGAGRAGRPRPADAPSPGAVLPGGGGGPVPAFSAPVWVQLGGGACALAGAGGGGRIFRSWLSLRCPGILEVCFLNVPGWKRAPERCQASARRTRARVLRLPGRRPRRDAVGGGGCPAPGILAATLRRFAGLQDSGAWEKCTPTT